MNTAIADITAYNTTTCPPTFPNVDSEIRRTSMIKREHDDRDDDHAQQPNEDVAERLEGGRRLAYH